MPFVFRYRVAGLLLVGITFAGFTLHPLLGYAKTSWLSELADTYAESSGAVSATAASARPTAPSNVAGIFDGQKTIRLSWRDNADNETSQQVWISKDGTNYAKLADLGGNITGFTHALGSVPTASAYYYKLRAVNRYGASDYSGAAKTVLSVTATPTHSPTTPPSQIIGDVLNEVNQFRAQNGLPALRLDNRLNVAAQRHSNDMALHKAMSHSCRDGTTLGQRITQAGYPWRNIAENVATGQTSARKVVQAWINSSGHRANMLKNNVKDVGIGYNNRYWTLDLAG